MLKVLQWVGGIALASLTAFLGTAFSGLFDEVLPSPDQIQCYISSSEKQPAGKFPVVLFAASDDDAASILSRIAEVAHRRFGVEAVTLCNRLRLNRHGVASINQEGLRAEAKAQLAKRDANLIVWGERESKVDPLWVSLLGRSEAALKSAVPFTSADVQNSRSELYDLIMRRLLDELAPRPTDRDESQTAYNESRLLRAQALASRKDSLSDQQYSALAALISRTIVSALPDTAPLRVSVKDCDQSPPIRYRNRPAEIKWMDAADSKIVVSSDKASMGESFLYCTFSKPKGLAEVKLHFDGGRNNISDGSGGGFGLWLYEGNNTPRAANSWGQVGSPVFFKSFTRDQDRNRSLPAEVIPISVNPDSDKITIAIRFTDAWADTAATSTINGVYLTYK